MRIHTNISHLFLVPFRFSHARNELNVGLEDFVVIVQGSILLDTPCGYYPRVSSFRHPLWILSEAILVKAPFVDSFIKKVYASIYLQGI